MNNEIEQLVRAASYVAEITPALAAASRIAENAGAREQADSNARITLTNAALANGFAPLAGNSQQARAGDAGNLAIEVNRLVEATRAAAAVNTQATQTTSTSAPASSDNGIAGTLLRTAAMMTGVGPVVTGLMKLFGGGESEPLPALEKFQAPTSVSVEAGLNAGRDFGSIRHTQGGGPEILPGAAAPAGPATIQVNIQAMDSQSFLDRQDDIARAVREAMLHSNSLNDVVMEL